MTRVTFFAGSQSEEPNRLNRQCSLILECLQIDFQPLQPCPQYWPLLLEKSVALAFQQGVAHAFAYYQAFAAKPVGEPVARQFFGS